MLSYVYGSKGELVGKFKDMQPVDLCNVFQIESVVNNGDHCVLRIRKDLK